MELTRYQLVEQLKKNIQRLKDQEAELRANVTGDVNEEFENQLRQILEKKQEIQNLKEQLEEKISLVEDYCKLTRETFLEVKPDDVEEQNSDESEVATEKKKEVKAVTSGEPSPLYSCPYPEEDFKWKGENMLKYSKESHEDIRTLERVAIVFMATNINSHPGAFEWMMMQKCFDSNFLLTLEKCETSPQVFQANVQLIGSKEEADRFKYTLEMSENGRKVSCEATTRSIQEGTQDSECLTIDANTAQLFAINGNISINVTITQLVKSKIVPEIRALTSDSGPDAELSVSVKSKCGKSENPESENQVINGNTLESDTNKKNLPQYDNQLFFDDVAYVIICFLLISICFVPVHFPM